MSIHYYEIYSISTIIEDKAMLNPDKRSFIYKIMHFPPMEDKSNDSVNKFIECYNSHGLRINLA